MAKKEKHISDAFTIDDVLKKVKKRKKKQKATRIPNNISYQGIHNSKPKLGKYKEENYNGNEIECN